MVRATRKTMQKEIIAKEIAKLGRFFFAKEIHSIIAKKERIGIATVYRFLKHMNEQGELHSYSCNGRTIYSSNTKSHSHFTCRVCGETRHIDIKSLDFVNSQKDGDICHFQINIQGICNKCKLDSKGLLDNIQSSDQS